MKVVMFLHEVYVTELAKSPRVHNVEAPTISLLLFLQLVEYGRIISPL